MAKAAQVHWGQLGGPDARKVFAESDWVDVLNWLRDIKPPLDRNHWRGGWKTWGPDGAAELLGLKPSTLSYQMKTLGIAKPSASRG